MKICLSIDGGGIKGLLPAMILERLEDEYGASAYQIFDMIGGVSTGGIIAGAAAVGIPGGDIVDLYIKEGPWIFKRPISWKIKTLWGLRGPKYPRKWLEKAIKKHVSDVVLDDVSMPILIPVQDITHNEPLFVKSHEDRWKDLPLKDVMIATSCAPTYFTPFVLMADRVVVDGGMVSNNPALYTYIEARKLWPEEDIFVLSIATSPDRGGMKTRGRGRWGYLSWARKIVNMFMSAAVDSAKHVMHQIIRSDNDLYIRLVPPNTGKPMDAAKKHDISDILALGEEYLLENTVNLHNIATLIKRIKNARSDTASEGPQS
jgi:patatin-like phospholipase/acyl hydrolase